jgi:hypothetical protein
VEILAPVASTVKSNDQRSIEIDSENYTSMGMLGALEWARGIDVFPSAGGNDRDFTWRNDRLTICDITGKVDAWIKFAFQNREKGHRTDRLSADGPAIDESGDFPLEKELTTNSDRADFHN